MALPKQEISFNFAQGLDTKTDPNQVAAGRFLTLQNMVFDTGGLLKKRNGFGQLASLADTTNTFLTTFNGNLTAIGTTLNAYASGPMTWTNKANFQSLTLSVLPIVRSNSNQTQCDAAFSTNGLVCVAYTDSVPVAGTPTNFYKYAIYDSTTGQNIISPVTITATGAPKVYFLGSSFVIVFPNTTHLQYIAVSSIAPTASTTAVDVSTQLSFSSTGNFDGTVANNNLYLAWNGSDGGGAVRITYIDQTLTQHNTVVFATEIATLMSVCADTSGGTPNIWVTYYNLATTTGRTINLTQALVTVLAATTWVAAGTILNVTATATSNTQTIFYEVSNAYSYDGAIATNFIRSRTCTTAGSLGTAAVVVRSVGLGSKAFIENSVSYFIGIYSSTNQPSYFVINSTGSVIGKLAYSNGDGYITTGLPNVRVNSTAITFPYLIKDAIIAVNKTQGASSSSAVYTQKGVNLATFTFSTSSVATSEVANNLHLSGGILWAYDGVALVEHGFHLFPDSVEATWSAAGGSIVAKPDGSTNTNAYYYSATYEWTDNQGNIFRSAPSIPVGVTTTGVGSAGSITVNVPTLRLTFKTANAVKIVLYRWSVGQQTYYQTTSITNPILNDTTVDSVQFVDTTADSGIIGNSIIYTAGGVVENIGAPATAALSLFKSRLFLIDAEDQNLLWYSKTIVEGAPVELSDLFTVFIAPTTSAQGSTGAMKCIFPMDDKLIIFKNNAIYYLVGNGPDSTGSNNDFSEPVFITSTVGCSTQNSIVFMPQGLMFKSDKGIWLLGRDLSTQYIGAPVEQFNSTTVLSAQNIPSTNQVRFTLSGGTTLVYDYYYGQWGTFTGISPISSTIYQNLHTFIDSFGRVFQETVGTYLDGSNPVLINFVTSWLKLGGLQGFQRAYWFNLIGTYISPHKLAIQIAYDYNSAFTQLSTIPPDNFNQPYGGDPLWGGVSPYGGNGTLEQWVVYLQQQKCESVQLKVTESYDPTLGVAAGAGFTLSGVDLTVGIKSRYPKLPPANSVG